MKHKLYLIILSAVVFGACGCDKKTTVEEPQPTQQPDSTEVVEPADLSLLEASVPVADDWVWSGKPKITIQVKNPNKGPARVPAKARIFTDKNVDVLTIVDTITVAGNSTQEFVLTTSEKMEPGIYRASCFVNGQNARSFNFAIDPFQITSKADKPSDFDSFWQTAKDQLAAIDMNPKLALIPERSSNKCKVYLVEMNSVPDGLSGEPVVIRGYYCEPQDGQQHAVILHFYGYDTQGYTGKVDCPWGGDHAEFYLSHRGQYLNNRPASTGNYGMTEDAVNIYGDWFSYHFGDKDSYYYRGAYMDVVQAIRFMSTRDCANMSKLFAEGSSQGGALTYVAAALSDWPFTAIAANVAFMGDFADGISIPSLAYWEINDNRGSRTDEEVLSFLSYFDIKNLTPRISCAVLASSGLQDGTCPPRLNIVPYNNLSTPAAEKEYIFGPEMEHSYPANWWNKMNELFGKYL